jgi:hypothetical protein
VCFSFIFHYEGTANFPNRQENLEKFFSFYKDFSKTLVKSTPERVYHHRQQQRNNTKRQ